MSPSVLAVIVTYNSASYIEACLKSLEERSVRMDVVIYDNGSHDGTLDRVRQIAPHASTIAEAENLGFAAAANRGARRADGHDYILLINPDCVIDPGAVDVLVNRARERPDEGLWGGYSYTAAGRMDFRTCLAKPDLWHAVSFALGLSIVGWPPFLRPDALGTWPRTGVREVPALTAAFLLIDADLWRRLGGMDETFFMFGEDVDFSMRARRTGARPTFVGAAKFMHVGSASFSDSADRRSMLLAAKASLYMRYAVAPTLASVLVLAGTGLRAALESVFRRGRTEWREAWRRRHEWRGGWDGRPDTCLHEGAGEGP